MSCDADEHKGRPLRLELSQPYERRRKDVQSLPGACTVEYRFLPSKIGAPRGSSCDFDGEANYGFVAPSTCGGVLSLPAYEWQNGCACAGC